MTQYLDHVIIDTGLELHDLHVIMALELHYLNDLGFDYRFF